MTGKTISHYKILEQIGKGGGGVVYKAEDTKLKRQVAIKFLPRELATDAEERERFKIEAQAAAALNHQNIATIYSIEEADDQTFIVMEYIEGQDLKRKTDEGPVGLDEALDIVEQISRGLQAAHDRGIVHRDIKSSNIIVTSRGHAKIMDFGVAKLTGSSGITTTGTTVGTVAYMSPEQIQSADVDHRTDLWSLGVLFYEMLTGQLPFWGDYEAAIIYKILNEEPRAIQAYRSDVPDAVVSAIFLLLQKDPGSRMSSAKEVIDRIRRKPEARSEEDEKKSIAVLYFENMSTEKENEYFCAGMTEDLIIDLSKIQGLKVIPRSDVLPFRNREIHTRRIGEALRVDYILEGSVRKSGNRIRTTAQLVDAQSGFQLWAERYDRLIEDIFEVQIEVSEKIAEALKVSLTSSEKEMLSRKPTDDMRAYDFYMRGSEFLSRRGQKDRLVAIQMLEHALSIDPNFSLACVPLAEAYSWNYLFYGGDRSWLEKMMEMNERALSLDPGLIEAQFGIGMVYFHQKRFDKAMSEFQKVLSVKSDYYPAQYWLGLAADILVDYDKAIEHYKSAAAIKPYSEEPLHVLEQSYRRKGDLDAAREVAKKVLEAGERKLEVNPNDIVVLSRVAVTYASRGESTKAIEAIRRIMEIDPNDGMALYNCAGTYACLGKKENALTYLESALEKGMMNLIDWIDNDPYLESIRDDPRFREILSKYAG